MKPRRAWPVFVCCLLAAAGARSAEVYRWTDANGRVFYGDRAPEGRRTSAKVIPIDPPPPVRVNTAEPTESPRPAVTANTRPAPPVQTAPAVIGPSQLMPPLEDKATRCAAAWRRFDESSACFAAFRVDGGRVLAQAYQRCESVAMPSDCGVHPGQ